MYPFSLRILPLVALLSLSACETNTAVRSDIQRYETRGDVEQLVNFAQTTDKTQRMDALRALGKVGDPRAVKVLTEALGADSWVERETAVQALSALKDAIAIPSLITALSDENQYVQGAAQTGLRQTVEHLIRKRDLSFYRPLFKGVHQSPHAVRQAIEDALSVAYPYLRRYQEATFIKPLIKTATEDDNRYARQIAVKALGEINNSEAMPALIAAQSDTDRYVREVAAAALARIKDDQAIEPLLNALASPKQVVRDSAIQALSGYTDAASVTTLINSLGESDPLVREGVATILGRIGDAQAIKPLIDQLTDKNSAVRYAVSISLDQLAWKPETADQSAAYCVARRDWSTCATLGDAAISALQLPLADDSIDIRTSAAKTLGQLGWSPKTEAEKGQFCVAKQAWAECVSLGELAVPHLVQALQYSDMQSQLQIINSLKQINSPLCIEPLVNAYAGTPPSVREAIVDVLGDFPIAAAVLPLIKAVDDKNRSVRDLASAKLRGNAEKIRKLGDAKITDALIIALKDNNHEVRAIAAELLGEARAAQATQSLIDALRDSDSAVRESASNALPKIKDASAIQPLVKALGDKDPEIRLKAIQTLAQFKDHRALEPLFQVLDDPDPEVRQSLVFALAKTGDARSASLLEKALKDMHPEVRSSAATALAALGNTQSSSKIIPLLDDSDLAVRRVSAKALNTLNWLAETPQQKAAYMVARQQWQDSVSLGEPAVPYLIFDLSFPDSNSKVESARSLGEIGDTRAIDPLIQAIEQTRLMSDREYAAEIINSIQRALVRIGKDANDAMVQHLHHWYSAQYLAPVLKTNGWIPDSDRMLVLFQVALRDGSALRKSWPLTKRILTDDLQSKNATVVANAVYVLIGLGNDEVMKNILNVLYAREDIALAETFLNSGNSNMERAAIEWARDRNLSIDRYSHGEQAVKWGRL